MKSLYIALALIVLGGCATLAAFDFEERFGPAEVQERVVSELPEDNIDYWLDVKPVVEQRCVVCHACFDAPCQLKMTAVEGIDRGASKEKVYNAARIKHAPLTRLFEDAQNTQQWRDKGFFPVLNEHGNSLEANKQTSLMYQLLELKEANPQPTSGVLPDDFSFGYDRSEVCATPEQMALYTKDRPLWGMPYALPGLANAEQATLKIWLEQGAKYTAREPLDQAYLNKIETWEKFLNGPARKQQLVNRYIYEHLFLANIYFSELDGPSSSKQVRPKYFRLVRSSTPPGQEVEIIATRRPYDDPDVPRVYYRLVEYLETIVTKTHLPYAFNKERLARYNELFYDTNYEVRFLPDYTEKVAANPFKAFEQLPMASRYKFMLDEAQYIIMNFIKGPVCRGQVAVNVIRDHFWVFFMNPDLPINGKLEQYVDIKSDELELPSAKEDIFMPLTNWARYAEKAKVAAQSKEEFMLNNFVSKGQEGLKVDLNLIWDGKTADGDYNQNAALTIFRHFDNASVHKGMLGKAPQTAWVIDYPLLEQIYYLLVAGYDVYGNVGHQLLSRLYMDFLRMDGENLFLDFLPETARDEALKDWYKDADEEVLKYFADSRYYERVGTSVEFSTDDPKTEMYKKLAEYLGRSVSVRHDLRNNHNDKVVEAMQRLSSFSGEGVSLLGELTIIEVQNKLGRSHYMSLIKNNAHKNITSMFAEESELVPGKHGVTVLTGITGSYPNTFMMVKDENVDAFVDQVLALNSEQDYAALMDKYGMRRSNPTFWDYSDRIHAFISEGNSVEAGYLDYNRLENR